MNRPVGLHSSIARPVLRPENLATLAANRGLALAAWQLPGTSRIRFLLAEKTHKIDAIRLDELGRGFLFSPFRPELDKFFLPADFILDYSEGSLIENPASRALPTEFIAELSPESKVHQAAAAEKTTETNADKKAYLNLVTSCLEAIASGSMEKIVAARRKTIPLPEEADPVKFFLALTKAYPHAMVSMVYLPESGIWIGASPEPLISVDRNQMFRTVALAGTKSFRPEIPIEEVTWTQKEIEEQALVERYIISCFKKIRLREYDEYGPKTFRAGNLLHLKSVFEVNLREVTFPELGTVMLELLHPTSAVCGMPRETSLEFIRRSEGFDREFYAGFLGPVNDDQETHLYVNLRCLKWSGQHAVLFAGAGITSGSNPEQEWEECEMKMETLHRHIRLSSGHTD